MSPLIDKQTILERVDLLTLAEHDSQLRKVATTGGGEWCGPCPFCGGRDRFRVEPYKRPWGLWMCRNCTGGKWQNAIDYVMQRDHCDFKAACAALAGGDLPIMTTRRPAPEIPAYDPPAGDWRAQALQAVRICADNLYKPTGAAALAYLKSRKLRDDTIQYWQLGYSPGAKFGELWLPRGVVIPCLEGVSEAAEVWYLKIALLPGDPVVCKCGAQAQARKPCPSCGEVNKYRGVRGNRTAAIFGAGELIGADIALFCEGEIDAMTAWQSLRDVVGVATLGAATNRLDLATWGAYLMPLRYILVTYDTDQAGEKGAEAFTELGALPCPLPEGVKDINDFTMGGGKLWPWLQSNLDRLGVLAELGANV